MKHYKAVISNADNGEIYAIFEQDRTCLGKDFTSAIMDHAFFEVCRGGVDVKRVKVCVYANEKDVCTYQLIVDEFFTNYARLYVYRPGESPVYLRIMTIAC